MAQQRGFLVLEAAELTWEVTDGASTKAGLAAAIVAQKRGLVEAAAVEAAGAIVEAEGVVLASITPLLCTCCFLT